MRIYNSVLMGTDGVIQRVRTNFFNNQKSKGSAVANIESCITIYTFSDCTDRMFTSAFSNQRFEVDNEVPDNSQHSMVQEIILTGSNFINEKAAVARHTYAELSFFSVNQEHHEREIENVLQVFINYSKIHCINCCHLHGWQAFAYRKVTVEEWGQLLTISLERKRMER